jgi:hypothetical protein
MDEVEQRLIDAMIARAELVTEESLRDNELPVREPRRWPALAAAAAVVLAVAGIVVGLSWRRAEPPTYPAPPPTRVTDTESPTPRTGQSAPSLAVPPPATGTTFVPNSTSTSVPPEPPLCGGHACALLSIVDVARDRVELWAEPDGAHWQIRVDGVVVPGGTSDYANRVACSVVAGRPVCLVYTWNLGDSNAQVGLERRDGWRFTGATFLTPYGAERIEPRDLYANGSIEVVSAETMNDNGLWTAQVWRWDGSRLGCTPHVDAKEKLPGWPAVAPDVTTLALANCWGG